jgi:lipid-A-disaccharide synthase
MKIFLSVGEPSGDLHGANLIAQLRRLGGVECAGFGGPRMAAAGCDLHEDLTRLAVMGLWRVLLNLHRFLWLLIRADRYFAVHRPDAVVLIDFPGFNWWIARRAKARGIPVYYYGAPQLWAWASWRVARMRRLVDHVLCKLPFEEEWFGRRGVRARYVGHPYFDQMRQQQLDERFLAAHRARPGRLVTLLPGSRGQEVTCNLPWIIKAAEAIAREVPDARFAVASYNERQAAMARHMAARARVPLDVFVGRTPELIHLAECCLACSGSVSLELLYHEKPAVILYWLQPLTYFLLKRFLVKVKYITLVNLLAEEDPFVDRPTGYDPAAPGAEEVPYPEYPTCGDESERMAAHVVAWLRDESQMASRVARLAAIKARLAHGGASETAARYILAHLDRPAAAVPRPPFVPAATPAADRREGRPGHSAALPR